MRWLALVAGLVVALVTAPVRADPDELVGDWVVSDAGGGSGQTISLRANGAYEYQITQMSSVGRKVVRTESSLYVALQTRLILAPRGRLASVNYTWRITQDDGTGRMLLFLYDDSGSESMFYQSLARF
jgi:hypothetical protein